MLQNEGTCLACSQCGFNSQGPQMVSPLSNTVCVPQHPPKNLNTALTRMSKSYQSSLKEENKREKESLYYKSSLSFPRLPDLQCTCEDRVTILNL